MVGGGVAVASDLDLSYGPAGMSYCAKCNDILDADNKQATKDSSRSLSSFPWHFLQVLEVSFLGMQFLPYLPSHFCSLITPTNSGLQI